MCPIQEERQVTIYVWPNGNWIYDWEVQGFTMQHSTVPTGGRWINIDEVYAQHLTKEEGQAILEALGE